MKLFGARKSDEKGPVSGGSEESDYFDSPSENVSLNHSPPAPARLGVQKAAAPADEELRPSYGIQNAIELMRALPVDPLNVELVVAVIKTTLESLKVRVSDIIEDAGRKQKDLESRAANLKQAIVEFEKEIQQRKDEISKIEIDHTETTDVKTKLELAEKLQKGQKPSPQSTKSPGSTSVVQPLGSKA